MSGTVVLTMVFSGLCFLPSCSPRFYVCVETPMSWSDAQTHCRSRFTDLATVHNETELAQLNQVIGGYTNVWIGLRPDPEAWRWSLENQDNPGEGEAGFRMWAAGEPNAGLSYYIFCGAMLKSGEWADMPCITMLFFICYDDKNPSSSFVFVYLAMSWTGAQQYCRDHYTDLASVRNQTENDQMKKMTVLTYTWIGLYRDSWKWTDGSPLSFSNWVPGLAPTAAQTDTCAASDVGKWINLGCSVKFYFACFADSVMKKLLVQVVLKNPDSSVDMEELNQDILQKLLQTLKDQGLDGDDMLRWVEQPNGKIFIKKT